AARGRVGGDRLTRRAPAARLSDVDIDGTRELVRRGYGHLGGPGDQPGRAVREPGPRGAKVPAGGPHGPWPGQASGFDAQSVAPNDTARPYDRTCRSRWEGAGSCGGSPR